jgi:hypothetical protein
MNFGACGESRPSSERQPEFFCQFPSTRSHPARFHWFVQMSDRQTTLRPSSFNIQYSGGGSIIMLKCESTSSHVSDNVHVTIKLSSSLRSAPSSSHCWSHLYHQYMPKEGDLPHPTFSEYPLLHGSLSFGFLRIYRTVESHTVAHDMRLEPR